MSDYVLSCCSSSDLSKEYFEKRNIPVVYFHFELGGTQYLDDMGESVPPKELFKRMLDGEDTKTSQVSMIEYEEFFEPFLKEGKDIIHVTLSSGLSGTINSANLAAENLKEKYPDRKIYIVDSLGASSGYGFLIDSMADLRDKGVSIDELLKYAEENRLHVHHWFFSTDLTFYIRGGRVSKAAGAIGTVLGICPLLNMDSDGLLIPREKVRGKKKVSQRIVDKMAEHADNGKDYSGKCFISHSDCLEDAQYVADLIEKTFPNLDGKVEIYPIGATIGSHTGPGTIAVFFHGDLRVK
ncbi:EDD domain protein, DegV family [Lachnospiraceae bacterium XPB1003]|jgi:DegV family protein with EDD domain|nr:EDD domain protein, DegV family [Lachnospiraceae bacterium XPB1003]